MKNLNIFLILAVLGVVFAFISCQDQDGSRFPDFIEAANVRIQVDPDYSSLNAADIPNAKLQFSLFSENNNLQSVVLSGVYYNFANNTTSDEVELMRWTQSDFDANNGAIRNVEFTSQFLADKFGLPNGIDDLGGGDRFEIHNVTTLTNGMVFPDSVLQGTPQKTINVTPNIVNSASTTSFSVGFTAYVSCPFIAADAVGTYEVVYDGWADWSPGDQIDVVANADGTGVIVKGMYSKFRNDDRGPYDVEVLVDAGTGIATVAKQPAWEWYWYTGTEEYGTGSVEGGGFVFSCSGIITLNLKHTVAAGSFGTSTLTLQKI